LIFGKGSGFFSSSAERSRRNNCATGEHLTERFVRNVSSGSIPNQERKDPFKMENKQDKGFTLVELLIVIVILGILATVTVFAVRGITDSGKRNSCSVDNRTLSTAIEAFYAQNQRDPATIAEMTGGTAPLLTRAPTNFTFVARASTVAPIVAAQSYTYPVGSWNAGTTVSNANGAFFMPVTVAPNNRCI